jgi:DnaJ-class molecular chaperone
VKFPALGTYAPVSSEFGAVPASYCNGPQEAPMTTRPAAKPGNEGNDDAPQTAENFCRRCSGSGILDSEPCPACDGTGRIAEIVGDA